MPIIEYDCEECVIKVLRIKECDHKYCNQCHLKLTFWHFYINYCEPQIRQGECQGRIKQ